MQKLSSNLFVSLINLLILLVVLLILLGVAFNLPWLPNRPDPKPANFTVMITTTPAPPAAPDEEMMDTAVALAFNLFIQTQEAGWTSTPLVVETPTPMIPTFDYGVASQTQAAGNPAQTTTDLAVDIRSMRVRFNVPRDSSLYLRDTSGDGKSNACTISKSGFKLSVTLPASGARSAAVRLPPGDYKLKCSGSNKTARIVSS